MLHVSQRLFEGMERTKNAVKGTADRVPVYAQMSHHSARLAGVSTYEFFTNAQTFLRCELSADEFYDFDSPTIHYDCYNIEAEAMGANLVWEEGEFPEVDPRNPLLKSIDDIKRLKPVRTGIDGRMPYILEINKQLADLGIPPKIRFCGVFTLAAKFVGFENLILAIKSEPEKVHRLMEFLTDEVIAPWIACQRTQSGCNEVATGSDALASPPILTIEMVREFCLRYIKRLESHIGKIRLAGIWGESTVKNPRELLDIKRDSSPGMVQVCDPDVNILGPSYFKRYSEDNNIGLIMGMDANLIRKGPVSAIKSRATKYIEEAGKDGRFILFINDIPYDTPPEHVLAVVSVAHEYCYRM